MRIIFVPLAAVAWLTGRILLLFFLNARLPLALTPESLRTPRVTQTIELPLAYVLEARWSVAFRTPTLRMRSSKAVAKIKFPQYTNADQLKLVRNF